MNISPTSTYNASDIGPWYDLKNYAWAIATIRKRHLPKPETWKEAFDMMGEFSTIPEGTHWGLNDEGVAGLWIHDLELFSEENKAEIERCLAEPHHINNCDDDGDHILSANGIRKCTIKEEENNE